MDRTGDKFQQKTSMEKFIIFVGCFAALIFLTEAGIIRNKKILLETSSEEKSSEESSLESKESGITISSNTLELFDDYELPAKSKQPSKISKWEKNADGLVVIPVTFDPYAGFSKIFFSQKYHQ